MAKTNLLVGLDVGSSKLTAIAAAYDYETNTLKVLTGRSITCGGVKGGMVSDIRETSAAVTHLLSGIERACEQNISSLFVGVRGSHLKSFTSHGTCNIARGDNEITKDDMDLAIESAKARPIDNTNQIVSVVTQGFAIDKQRGIKNPEGMEGSLLEVDVHITTGASTHINNLAKAIQRPGYNIDGMVYSLVPLADNVLTEEEKEIGTLILDMGGETMSAGIYEEGILKYSIDIPYGCDIITRDLAGALHTSRQNAQEIKEKYGVSFPTFLDEEGEIPVPSLDGGSIHNIKKSYILEIIQPRVEELIAYVGHRIEKSECKVHLNAGVVTGGGSLMPGITDHFGNILGLKEVRRGVVQRELITSDDEFFNPLYSTAMALAINGSKTFLDYGNYSENYSSKSSSFGKLGKIFKDLFGG